MNEEIKEARKVSTRRAHCSPGLKALCIAVVLGCLSSVCKYYLRVAQTVPAAVNPSAELRPTCTCAPGLRVCAREFCNARMHVMNQRS